MSTRIITKMNELTGGLISKGELARENLYKQKKTMKCASYTGGDFRNILSSELKRDADAWFIASQSKKYVELNGPCWYGLPGWFPFGQCQASPAMHG